MKSLSLFSGYSGLDMAISDWAKPILYCEKDLYAKGILLSRMDDGSIPFAPIWNDVTTLDGNKLRGLVDLIVGGFPCQDLSVAGRGAGLAGKRSGLFYEVVRLVKEIRPSFVFLENVPAIRTRGLEQVIKEFAEMGYDCRWTMLSASSVGANHKRERWFLLASKPIRLTSYAHSERVSHREQKPRQQYLSTNTQGPRNERQDLFVAHTMREGLERHGKLRGFTKTKGEALRLPPYGSVTQGKDWWATEPDVGRVANGVECRVDRIKALGNGVVPLQAKEAFIKLMGLK